MNYYLFLLGNPGVDYAKTRHNAARIAFEDVDTNKFSTLKTFTPDTYMNESGDFIQEKKNYFKLENNNIIIAYDDKDLPLGDIKISYDRSSGKHNGVESVIKNIGPDFWRIRIGIGEKDNPNMVLADYVLSKFSDEEIEALKKLKNKLEDILKTITEEGGDKAMNKFN
jgi:PTH1 family peptidyl-tRNA hydrolase